jgi:nitrogenase subunit NifH
MFDGRNSLSNEVSEQLQQHFGSKVFRTVVPRNVRLAEAPSHGKPVIDYDRSCIGTQAYLALAGELVGPTRGDVHGNEAIHSASGETTGSDRVASPAGNVKW